MAETKAFDYLLNNLKAIDAQLATIESEQTLAATQHVSKQQLDDDSLHGVNDIWLRLSRNLTPESALFRHA